MRSVKILSCTAALIAFLGPGTHAGQWDSLTYLTFSRAVQIPSATLPAGTYAFRAANQFGNPHVIQVLSKDMRTIYATELAVPHQRFEATSKPVVVFNETRSGTPPAIRAWYSPGELIGNEFVYQAPRATGMARTAGQPVPATSN